MNKRFNSNDSRQTGLLFFPQIISTSGASNRIISKAFESFCGLFDIQIDNLIADSPLLTTRPDLFDLSDLSRSLVEIDKPIYVFGTFSFEDLVGFSWDELGLNVFDLSWFSGDTEKVFKYISLLSLPENLKELKKLSESVHNPNFNVLCRKAVENLQWAKCHKFATAIQNAVGHGNRDSLQNMPAKEFSNSIRQIIENSKTPPCNDSCGLRAKAVELITQINRKLPDIDRAGDEDGNLRHHRLELLNFAREIANLDCTEYRLAPVIYFEPDPATDVPKFERIIILDDSEPFRRSLKEMLRHYLKSEDDIDNKIVFADVKKSWELYRLSDADGRDLIWKFYDKEKIPSHQILACFDLDLDHKKNAPGGLHNHPDVSDLGFGYFGLRGVETYTSFLASCPPFLRRLVRSSTPIRFGDICNRLGLEHDDEIKHLLWQTLRKIPRVRLEKNHFNANTLVSYQ